MAFFRPASKTFDHILVPVSNHCLQSSVGSPMPRSRLFSLTCKGSFPRIVQSPSVFLQNSSACNYLIILGKAQLFLNCTYPLFAHTASKSAISLRPWAIILRRRQRSKRRGALESSSSICRREIVNRSCTLANCIANGTVPVFVGRTGGSRVVRPGYTYAVYSQRRLTSSAKGL